MQPINQITTCNGKYYAGMTLETAKDKKTFSKIDLDHNNVLSPNEIFYHRDKDAKASKMAGLISMGIAALGTLFANFGLLGIVLLGSGAMIYKESKDINNTTNIFKSLAGIIEKMPIENK